VLSPLLRLLPVPPTGRAARTQPALHKFYGGPYASYPTTALSGHTIPLTAPKALHTLCRTAGGPLRLRRRERARALFEVGDLLADRVRAADDRRLDDAARVVREEVARAATRDAVRRSVGRARARGRTRDVSHVRARAWRDPAARPGAALDDEGDDEVALVEERVVVLTCAAARRSRDLPSFRTLHR